MIHRAAITAARRQLASQPGFLRTTPLLRLSGRSLGVDCDEVWLKLEQLQVGGSFKARGMLYRLLANPVPDSGVIIASGGNAGIAVAAAAKALGVRCEVFVPEVSPEAKRARLRALGAEVVVTGAAYAEAFQACVARQQATGALQAHAYDQPEVVAGAGLIGGVAAWVDSRAHVVALEPERAPTLHAARAAGMPVDVEVGGLAADSLGARRIGAIGWEVSQRHVHASLLLPDDAIRAAQLWLWKEFKLAVEPAAALGLAALQTGAYRPQPRETVALILCGANCDPASLA